MSYFLTHLTAKAVSQRRLSLTLETDFIIIQSIFNVAFKYHMSYFTLKVIYHPLYSMNIFVTIKSKLPQDGAQVFHPLEVVSRYCDPQLQVGETSSYFSNLDVIDIHSVLNKSDFIA